MWKIRNSFWRVKRDYRELKTNVDGWIGFFDRKNKDFEKKMERMEDKIERMEERMVQMIMMQK